MWRARQKELELNDQLKGRSRAEDSSRKHRDTGTSSRNSSKWHDTDMDSGAASCSSSKRVHESSYSRDDGGLRDEEIEEFLHSRSVVISSSSGIDI